MDEAFRWLEIAVQEKASGLILLRVHPRLDPIRSDPRYWPLVQRVGLDDSSTLPEPDLSEGTRQSATQDVVLPADAWRV